MLSEEVVQHRLAMLVNLRLLLQVLFGELVQLFQQGLHFLWSLRDVPSILRLPIIFLNSLLHSLSLHVL